MRIIVVTFYDKENKQFYQAVKDCLLTDETIEWLSNLDISKLANFLSQKHDDSSYENDFSQDCPCLALLREMVNQGFYYCNFENCDYTYREYLL